VGDARIWQKVIYNVQSCDSAGHRRRRMKITKVETIRVAEMDRICWVQIHTDEGQIGLGETWYGARCVEAAVHELFVPLLVGRNPLDIERHWFNMFRLADHWGYGGAETRAISAIDIALWDIAGQAAGLPIYDMLGGACRDRIRIYNTGGGPEWPHNPVPWAKENLSRGITAMKVGAFPDHHKGDGYSLTEGELEKIVEPVRRIREAIGDAMEIAIDGHGFWSLHNATRLGRALDQYRPLWLEEMMSTFNVDSHLRLAEAVKAPVCLAERLVTRYQFREYVERGAAEIVMPDLIWTGGISETKKIATLAETYQVPVCPHDCTGPVNVFACAHICMNAPNAMLMETTRPYYDGWYGKFVTNNLNIQNGHLLAPEGPGLGTKLLPEVRNRKDVSIETSDKPREHYLGWLH
jgi:L-alanine-DL-glutamate epimerase-like enolase superfamily enzyme